MSLSSAFCSMSRAPFSSERDTRVKRQQRERVQHQTPQISSGYFLCDTEVDDTVEHLPYTLVQAKPDVFRPTKYGATSTYYTDTVFQDAEYPLVLIENKPRLAKFQPEVRAILSPDGQMTNVLCRTASNLPLGSHPELKKQLTDLVGKGPVIVNLTPASVDPIVAAIGNVAIHSDDLPILLPISPNDTISLLTSLSRRHFSYADEKIHVAKTAPELNPLKRKREENVHKTGRAKLHELARKGSRYRNKETQKAKLRRLNSDVST